MNEKFLVLWTIYCGESGLPLRSSTTTHMTLEEATRVIDLKQVALNELGLVEGLENPIARQIVILP